MDFNQYKLTVIPDAEFYYIPNIFGDKHNASLFDQLKAIDWKQESLVFAGRTVPIPRLTRFYGQKEYSYSGLVNKPEEFPKPVIFIHGGIEGILFSEGITDEVCIFNSVLLNYYRSGNDSISWHSDDETSLGKNPHVASFSLGADRVFKLRNKKTKVITGLCLENGSLLYMGNNSQLLYEHSIQKTKSPIGERINLTFRKIK